MGLLNDNAFYARSRRKFIGGLLAPLVLAYPSGAGAVVTMRDYTILRAYRGAARTVILTREGIEGTFELGTTDELGRDNGGTIIVDTMGRSWKRLFTGDFDVRWWGAIGNDVDESKIASAMISSINQLIVPTDFTLTCKNVELNDKTKVIVKGGLKLPPNCVDNDKILFADNKYGLDININDIDGNSIGQSGQIGTHLIYITRCHAPKIKIKRAHHHYAEPVGWVNPGPDRLRNTSAGAIYMHTVTQAEVKIDLLDGWGREGVYLAHSIGSVVSLGHAQGRGHSEYSGLQISGKNNTITNASVDYAGASAVGFDTENGRICNILVTRTRENSGVNFGHPGNPASGSVGDNIIVRDSKGDGISVGAGTVNLTLTNVEVKDAGNFGIRISDSAQKLTVIGGSISGSGRANWCASAAEIIAMNVNSDVIDVLSLVVSSATALFIDDEMVTGRTGSGVIRKMNANLTGSAAVLHLSSGTGSFLKNETVFGLTSGAVATIDSIFKPSIYYVTNGGVVSINQNKNRNGTDKREN